MKRGEVDLIYERKPIIDHTELDVYKLALLKHGGKEDTKLLLFVN